MEPARPAALNLGGCSKLRFGRVFRGWIPSASQAPGCALRPGDSIAARLELTGRPFHPGPGASRRPSLAGSGGACQHRPLVPSLYPFCLGREAERPRLVWVNRSGKELEQKCLAPILGERASPSSLSPDGLLQTNASVNEPSALKERPISGSWSSPEVLPTRFTSHPEFELYPVWSPDGKRIAFQSNREATSGTTFDTYVKSVGGTGNEELLVGGEGGQIPTDACSTDDSSFITTLRTLHHGY